MRIFEITEAETVEFDYEKIKAMPAKERMAFLKANPEIKDQYNKEWQKRIDADVNNYDWMSPEEKAEYEKLAKDDAVGGERSFGAEKYLKRLFQKRVDAKKAASMSKVHWTTSEKISKFLDGSLSNKVELSAYLAPNPESIGKGFRWGDIGVVLDGHITMAGRGDLGSDQYKEIGGQRGQQKYVSRPGQVDPKLGMDTTSHHEVLIDNWKIKEIVLAPSVPEEIETMIKEKKIPVRRLDK